MATVEYRATVEPNGSLVLPKEAQAALHLKPGEEMTVRFERPESPIHNQTPPDNEGDSAPPRNVVYSCSQPATSRFVRRVRVGEGGHPLLSRWRPSPMPQFRYQWQRIVREISLVV